MSSLRLFPPCDLIPRCWEWGLLGAYPILPANSYSDRSAIAQVVVSLITSLYVSKDGRELIGTRGD